MHKTRIYQPSQAQIHAACLDIQQRWTDKERAARARGVSDTAWYPRGVLERLRIGLGKGAIIDEE